MEFVAAGGVFAAILGVVYYMTRRARADDVIASLQVPDHIEEVKEIIQLSEEVKNAKIEYRTMRDEYNRRAAESSAATPDVQRPPEG